MSKKDNAVKRDLGKARLWAKERRWNEEAAALNTKIIRRAPDRVGAYVRRGRCYLEMGLLEEAEKDFRIALDKDPQNGEARELQAIDYLCDRTLEQSSTSERPGSILGPVAERFKLPYTYGDRLRYSGQYLLLTAVTLSSIIALRKWIEGANKVADVPRQGTKDRGAG